MKKLTKIPNNWHKKQIKDLLDYERPDSYIVKDDHYTSSGKTPVLTANKSFILGYTDEDFGIYTNTPAIIFDDFTTDSKYVDFPFKVKSSAIKILKIKNEDVDIRFVYEKMKSINFPTGSHKRFYISQYQNMEVIVPSYFEQKRISEILRTVDEEIQKTQTIIDSTEKLKQGLMQQLFTKGIGHTKFKKTQLGRIPEEWQVITLGEIGKNFIGLTYSPTEVVQTGGTLVLRSSNIKGSSIAYGDNVYVKKIIPDHLLTIPGDILLCTRNGSRNLIGKSAYINDKSAGHSFGAFMSVYRTKHSDYIFQIFQSKLFKKQIEKHLGSTINQITTGVLNTFTFALPSISEQKEIVNLLCTIDKKYSINQEYITKLVLLKKGLMQDLLNGRVRVN